MNPTDFIGACRIYTLKDNGFQSTTKKNEKDKELKTLFSIQQPCGDEVFFSSAHNFAAGDTPINDITN